MFTRFRRGSRKPHTNKEHFSARRAYVLSFVLFCSSTMWGSPQRTPDRERAPADALTGISEAVRSGQFEAALRLCESAARRYPADPRLPVLQGVAYSGLGENGQALKSYRHSLRIAPEYLPALQGAAQLEYAAHSPAAKPLLEQIVKQQPDSGPAHAMLAVLAFDQGDCAGSVRHFELAEALIKNQPAALSEYSSCLVRLSRFEDALPVFSRLVDLSPQNEAARYNLALAEWNAGHPAEALSALEPNLTSERSGADELTLAAEIRESLGQTQSALELLRRAVLLHPRDKNAYLDFVNLAYEHTSAQVGLDMVNLGLKELPNEAELYLARGVLLCQTGQTEKGLEDFAEANRLNPELSFTGVAEGIAESQSHESSAALGTFREQVRKHPNDALAQYLLAEALSEVEKQPGGPEEREEVEAARKSIRLDPKRIESHDLLATLYLQEGKNDAAEEESRAALAVDPKDQQALYHLVLALRKTGDKEQLPGILARLMQAREESQAQAKKNKKHLLVEQPAARVPGPG